jgi:hypothetical protein
MLEINADDFITWCEDNDIEPHPRYSGRGMYGKQCVGIVGGSAQFVAFMYLVVPKIDPRFNVQNLEQGDVTEFELEFSDEWLNMKTDSMGRDTIYYWPNVHAAEIDAK